MMKKIGGTAFLLSMLLAAGFNQAMARPLNDCVTVNSGGRPQVNEGPADAQGRCPAEFVLYRTAKTPPACFRVSALGAHDMPPKLDGTCNRDTQLNSAGWCRSPGIPQNCSPNRR